MHWLLTERQRQSLSSVVILVVLAVLPMSLSLLVTTIYIRLVVDDELDLVQGLNTPALPYFLAATGTVNCLSSLLLLYALARAHRLTSRAKALQVLFVAIIIFLLATVVLLSGCIYCFVELFLLSDSFQNGLKEAMKKYSNEPDTKTRLDILQMDYACCGDDSFKDWFQVPWVSKDFLVADSKELTRVASTEYLNDDVPFSCCDPASPRPCIHHHVTTNRLHFDYNWRELTTLYTEGCRHTLMDFFGNTILRTLAVSLLIIFLAQVGALLLTRFVHTSMKSALKAGNMTAPAEGHLFKKRKGPPGTDAEGGDYQPLLQDEDSEQTASTTDTEGADEEGRLYNVRYTGTSRSTTDEEPIYENIIPGDYLEEDGPWDEPRFPSEDPALNNSAIYSDRRASKGFDSLGIQLIPRQPAPPQPPSRCTHPSSSSPSPRPFSNH